ncbi:TPA: fimbrial biogenesis chaperone [Klebsiella oxytoca]
MKKLLATLPLIYFLNLSFVHAGVVIGGTRIIYEESKKEASISLNNPDKMAYLVQSWIESSGGGGGDSTFIVTPPLFRLPSGEQNVLRIFKTNLTLPKDKETMYWLNIKTIPSTDKYKKENTLQLAVNTRIKLIYRPAALSGTPEESADKLRWARSENEIEVTNESPYYMNFQSIKVGGKAVKNVTYVAPLSSARFTLPDSNSHELSWELISDYGGIGPVHTTNIK